MYQNHIKRIIDIVTSLLGSPLVFLVSIPVAVMIKLEDGGPVFYSSLRRGKNGIPFKMCKFRSMKVNAPDIRNSDGSTFNSENDPRLTRTGKLLRKTSIDELPQLINVIRGEMSIVGPRPTMTDTPLSEYDDLKKKRITIRPGITGYSQAYFRNSISARDKFLYDCFYVDNVSFLLDMKIIFKTIVSSIKQEKVFITGQDIR
ncbi:MAG TPA: sugar transferase [Bacteroidales bacterium]|nr:sugar transferase [Bacteroidales bacterium]HQK68437.1 sugar transferase [Bacteroidales bacterium]